MRKIIGVATVTMLLMFLFVGCSGGTNSTPKKGILMKQSNVALSLSDQYNSVQLDVDVAEGTKVDWVSSDTSVATVEDGMVTAHAVGKATITATIDGTSSVANCVVTVYKESPISITPSGNQEMYTGNTMLYKAFDSQQPGVAINFLWSTTGGVSVTPQGANSALITADTPGDAGVWVNEQGQEISVFKQITVKSTIQVLQSTVNMVYGQSPIDLTTVIKLPSAVAYSDVSYASQSDLISITPTSTGGKISFNQLPAGDSLPSSVVVSMTINKKESDGQVYKDTQNFTISIKPPIVAQEFSPNHYAGESISPKITQNLSGGTIEWSDSGKLLTITNGTTATPNISINAATSTQANIYNDTIFAVYTSATNLTYRVSFPLNVYKGLGTYRTACEYNGTTNQKFPIPIPVGWTITITPSPSGSIDGVAIDASNKVVGATSQSADPIAGVRLTYKTQQEFAKVEISASSSSGIKITGNITIEKMN